MKLYDVEVSGRRLLVATGVGRRIETLATRVAVGLPVASSFLLAFFMVDMLGPKTFDAEKAGYYALSAVLLGALFAVAWSVSGAMRHEEWELDFSSGIIRYETRLSWGSPQGVEVDASNLRGVRWVQAGVGRESRVELEFDANNEVAASTRLGSAKLREVAEEFRRLAEGEHLPFQES